MLKNQENAKEVLKAIAAAQQSVLEFSHAVEIEDYTTANTIAGDLRELLGRPAHDPLAAAVAVASITRPEASR